MILVTPKNELRSRVSFRTVLISALVFSGASSSMHLRFASAQETPTQIAQEMLVAICGSFNYEGSSQTLTISGDVEAELNGLVRKLVNLGVSGAANFESKKYINVLHEELGGELKSVRDCNLIVWPDLKNLVTGQPTTNVVIDKTINSNGNSNVNISGDNASVNSGGN